MRRAGIPGQWQEWVGLHYWSPVTVDPIGTEWVRFGTRASEASGVHLFVDDWRVESLWRNPERGLRWALDVGRVTAPDWSVGQGQAREVQRWQTYRSAAVGSWWSVHGPSVLPVAQWQVDDSGRCVCDYFGPVGSWVAVRGPQFDREQRFVTDDLWLDCLRVWCRRAEPLGILAFGRWPFLHRKVEWSRTGSAPVRTVPLVGGVVQ